MSARQLGSMPGPPCTVRLRPLACRTHSSGSCAKLFQLPGGVRKVLAHASKNSREQPDLVERVFGKLFGQTALDNRSPGGMKRMSDEAMLEQYPATTTEFAAVLDSDDSTVQTFRPLLAQTRLEKLPLRLAYSASQHGWSSAAFHEQVNTYGGCLILAQSQGGAVFGGYNPRGWIGIGEDRNSLAAFLFSWPDGDTSKSAVKLPKVGGASLAIMDDPQKGIQFGAEGLSIPLSKDSPKAAKCRLGTYYAKSKQLAEGGRSLFAVTESWKGTQLTDLKAYVAEGPAEEWNLDGIVWKSKS